MPGMLEDTPDDEELKVGIVGGGHLGKQLAHTLLRLVPIPAECLRISTRRPEALGEEHWVGTGLGWCPVGGEEAVLKGSLGRGILDYSRLSSQLASPEKRQKDGLLTCPVKQLLQ